ncbi:MAG TPA: thiamine-phosphate kinase [Opitutaceae bacterium]|nr:thiamine-phosphate kinase [Opitutaceae bacterium]
MHPFTARFHDSVSSLGETRLIACIRRWLGNVSPPPPFGIGDDCALLPPNRRNQLITTDPVIYGRHFDDAVPPRAVGAMLLKRNLSDLAAMGARPTAAVIALALDPRVRTRWLELFYRGLAGAARRFDVPIVGGDVAQGDRFLGAFLTLFGEAAGPRVVARGGARCGDWIYVTGTLGGSRLGHHWRFAPRLAEGAWLARRPEVRAMMDVSDGLAKDLYALTPPRSVPALRTNAIPLSPAARTCARRTGRTPLAHALADGEDYELVFAVDGQADQAALARAWRRAFPRLRITCIGRFVSAGNVPPDSLRLEEFRGYEHLRRTLRSL